MMLLLLVRLWLRGRRGTSFFSSLGFASLAEAPIRVASVSVDCMGLFALYHFRFGVQAPEEDPGLCEGDVSLTSDDVSV